MISNPKESCPYGDYPTPQWVSELLIEKHFNFNPKGGVILEPTCGVGSFLSSIPKHIPAIGIELQSDKAKKAREITSRPVICKDFLSFEPGFKESYQGSWDKLN